jgi:hypothetical protein
MDVSELHKKLIAAARADRPGDTVPYAFERRIMARLGSVSATDPAAEWARALWRAAAPCVGVMLVLGAWVFLAPSDPSALTGDLSQEFENTVLAAVTQTDSAW